MFVPWVPGLLLAQAPEPIHAATLNFNFSSLHLPSVKLPAARGLHSLSSHLVGGIRREVEGSGMYAGMATPRQSLCWHSMCCQQDCRAQHLLLCLRFRPDFFFKVTERLTLFFTVIAAASFLKGSFSLAVRGLSSHKTGQGWWSKNMGVLSKDFPFPNIHTRRAT